MLDFGDVVIHVMSEDQRNYYDLESFYGAAEEVSMLCSCLYQHLNHCVLMNCKAKAASYASFPHSRQFCEIPLASELGGQQEKTTVTARLAAVDMSSSL